MEVVTVAHMDFKTRTISMLLFTCPIFLSTEEEKSIPASSKENIVNEEMEDSH